MFSDVHISTMLATLIIFLAMIIILNSLLYKPLLKFMDDRVSSIESDENKVKNNFTQMNDFNQELENIKQSTREEVASIKQKLIDEAKALKEQELEAKKKENEQKMKFFDNELSGQKNSLKESLKTQIPLWQEALKANLNRA